MTGHHFMLKARWAGCVLTGGGLLLDTAGWSEPGLACSMLGSGDNHIAHSVMLYGVAERSFLQVEQGCHLVLNCAPYVQSKVGGDLVAGLACM